MLLNHNDTLDAAFTVAHEMGHSMHTVLSHAHQPFVYAGYTIFVAEVPSTLAEALFLQFMLSRATDERERSGLLQHAIDGIVSTFYTQVMFADYELQAHRLVEEGKPVTAEALGDIYFNLLKTYHGDATTTTTWRALHGRAFRTLQHADYVLPARHVLRVQRAADEAGSPEGLPPIARRHRPPSDAAQVRWIRSSDGAAEAGRRGPWKAGNRPRSRRSTRRARHTARKRDCVTR
jgi:hypothetical protein